MNTTKGIVHWFALCACMTLMTFAFSGCAEPEGPFEAAGERVDEAVEEAGEAAEDARENVEEAAEEAAEAVREN